LRCCLGYFKWGLLVTVLLGLGLWLYIGRHMDDELRRQVEACLAARFPHLLVAVDSARLVDGEGIHLKGVHLRDPAGGGSADLAAIDEVLLSCDTTLKKLLTGDVEVQKVVLRHARLYAARQADGGWNVARLWQGPGPLQFAQPVSATVEHGSIEIVDATRSPPSRYSLRDVQLALDPASLDQHTQAGTPEGWRIAGRLQGDHLRQIEFQGRFFPAERCLSAEGQVVGVEVSPAFFHSLPGQFSFLQACHWLQARADVAFRISYNPQHSHGWQFATTTQLREGVIEHPGLPYPLRELQATVQADNQRLVIEKLTARNQQTTLELFARRDGWHATAPLTLHVKGERLVFDQRLLEALPPQWRSLWQEFSPAGEADINARLAFDGRAWGQNITLTARNVSLTYAGFPYPLQRTTGAVTLQDGALNFNLTGEASGVPVLLKGRLDRLLPQAVGKFTISGQKLHIDPELIAALDPDTKQVTQAFQPRGLFDLFVEYSRPQGGDDWQVITLIDVFDGFVRYQHFPYPLSNISGRIEQRDDHWIFKRLVGSNGSGQVSCNGAMRPQGQGRQLELGFHAEKVALNEELRSALGPQARSAWDELQPQGAVRLDVRLGYSTTQGRQHLQVMITPEGDSLMLEPRSFPYRLARVQGSAIYQDGRVTLTKCRAEHGETAWQAESGYCHTEPDGTWRLQFSDIDVERLRVDRDLLHASPPGLRDALLTLYPIGPFHVHGVLSISRGPRAGDTLRSDWNVVVTCHRNSVQVGIPIDDVFGSVALRGQHQPGNLYCFGQLQIDSLATHGFHFTNVTGPFEIFNDRVLLGTPSLQQLQPGPEHLTAQCYGGTIYGDGWIDRRLTSSFSLRAGLQNGDLARFSREAVVGQQTFAGRADGAIRLNGDSRGVHTLQGAGNLRLRDANIYELPVMLSLLKVLSLLPPDLTAFTTSDIDFALEDRYVYFRKIDLNGDALSLKGAGYLSFDKQLGLRFHPKVGRGGLRLPIISDVMDGASSQILELYVGGTLDNPDVRREPFPGLKEALDNLQPPPFLQPPAPASRNSQPSPSRPNRLLPWR
jgi:hypothetical protein